jgi:hypothetical protein
MTVEKVSAIKNEQWRELLASNSWVVNALYLTPHTDFGTNFPVIDHPLTTQAEADSFAPGTIVGEYDPNDPLTLV